MSDIEQDRGLDGMDFGSLALVFSSSREPVIDLAPDRRLEETLEAGTNTLITRTNLVQSVPTINLKTGDPVLVVETEGASGWIGCGIGHLSQPLASYSDIDIRIASLDGDATVQLEFINSDNESFFGAPIDLRADEWVSTSLPLRWFSGQGHVCPKWGQCDYFSVRFFGSGKFLLTSPEIDTNPAHNVTLTATDVAEVLKPHFKSITEYSLPGVPVTVITDIERQMATERVGHYFKMVEDSVLKLFPEAKRPSAPQFFVHMSNYLGYVTARQCIQQRLCGRSSAVPDGSSAFSFTGVPVMIDYHRAAGGFNRDTAHEYTHALMEELTGLSEQSGWFGEGVAELTSYDVHSEYKVLGARLAEDTYRKLSTPGSESVVQFVCDGERLHGSFYDPSAVVMFTIANTKAYREKLPELIEHFRETRDMSLINALPVLGASEAEFLEKFWESVCYLRGLNG